MGCDKCDQFILLRQSYDTVDKDVNFHKKIDKEGRTSKLLMRPFHVDVLHIIDLTGFIVY